MEMPPSLTHHKNIKWRDHPLPSMVFDNPWFCSMVWLQGTLYLSHPWYFTIHVFDPWYFPKVHCNNVIKRLYAFSIKHSRIFGILHFSYSIELLGYLLDFYHLINMIQDLIRENNMPNNNHERQETQRVFLGETIKEKTLQLPQRQNEHQWKK